MGLWLVISVAFALFAEIFLYTGVIALIVKSAALLWPLRLYPDRIVIRKFLVPNRIQDVATITSLVVQKAKWGGPGGYRGYVLMFNASGDTKIIGHSLGGGRRRLELWARSIESSPVFDGQVTVIEGEPITAEGIVHFR